VSHFDIFRFISASLRLRSERAHSITRDVGDPVAQALLPVSDVAS